MSNSFAHHSFSRLSHAFKQSLNQHAPIKLGHVQQILAASLGHGSLASFQASDLPSIENATHICLDLDQAWSRTEGLGIPIERENICYELQKAFTSILPEKAVHLDMDRYLMAIQSFIDTHVINDEDVNSEMAMTNGWVKEIECPLEWSEKDILGVGVGDFAEVDIEGEVRMQRDFERVYYGHRIRTDVSVHIERLGIRLFSDAQVCVSSAKLVWFDEETSEIE